MGKTIRFNENGLIAIKKRLNEVMVGIDDVSHNDVCITLYHGTDIESLVKILKTNRMCASEGVQHGETYGINWFSLNNGGNFNKGACLSIEVPRGDFDTMFKMMNKVDVQSKASSIDISRYNPQVEYFCGHTREGLNNCYKIITEKGERFPIEWMRDEIFYKWCERSGNEDTFMTVNDYDFGVIMTNILGDEAVRKEGFIDEEVGEEFAPVTKIGGEEKNGDVVACGNYFHEEQPVNEGTLVEIKQAENEEIYSEAFKSWFGDWENVDADNFWYDEDVSKVVDNNLRPGIVKHGTPNKFDKFDAKMIGTTTDPGWLGTGFYFYGDNDIYAGQYAGRNGTVMECYLNIRNPYIAIGEDMERLSEANSKEASDEFREYLESEGYDGVYYNGDLNEEWVAFYPEQIRKVGSFGINERYNVDMNTVDTVDSTPQESSLQLAIKMRPDRFKRWAVIFPSRPGLMPQYFEKIKTAKEFKRWYRQECEIVDLDKYITESVDFDSNGMSINDDKILGKYNLKDLILSKTGNYVTLNKIVAKELGKGYGSRFMEELTRMADKNGWTLALTPDTSFGGSSVGRLKKFYKRFGFVPNKGRSTDFNTRESMIRKPCELKKNIIIPENRLIVLKENLEPEVSSSEVDLSSFKKRDTLPPGIWKDEETLDSKVRLKLLDIADDFWEFVNLSWVEPKGIIITGSICNFNWSKFSDIDLHLIVDFSEIDSKTEFVKQYLDSKKNEWNTEHEGLKIMEFPVELYVQDIDENPEAGGIYDLEENAWIRRPNPHTIKSIGLNKFNIKDKAAEIMTIIDDMYKVFDTATDGHVIDKIGEDAGYLWKKVKDLRKKSLDKNGESGAGNIVYKVLRRAGYLDKLFKLSTKVYDRANSITESKEILNEFLDSNYGMPLYKYFQWAEKASDREKVEDLFYHCPWIIGKYLSDVSGYDEELSDLEDELENSSDLEYDDEYIESVLDALEKHKLLRKLLEYPYKYADAEELPAWFTMDFIRVVKNEWCIHFTSDANNIAREGFTGGTPEVENIAYTNAGMQKHYAGYDFAFLIDDSSVDFNGYGDEAVIFRASGVLLLHYGDEQRQVVFWGPSVKELIPIKKDDYSSDWIIEGLNGQVFKTGKPSELADWATDNLPQYRNQIVAGKSGYRPWGFSRPTFDHEFMKPPLSNESVKKYLTLLKEEVALDGSTEDNPYEERWKAERKALKDFVANYGKLMQSREDNKGGKLYKVYYDETMSKLIGYNYCICVQWNEQEMKPGTTVYIRALDKFTPFIRRNLQFDTRGRDNMRGTPDDTGY